MSNGKISALVEMRTFIDARKNEIKNSLPPDITYESFLRAFTTGATLNPDLLTCSKQSIWLALIRACRDGLLPDGKESALVPYKDRATYIPMYSGLLRRFRRSGQFKSISAHIVYEGEQFEHYIDENGPHLKHVPGDNFDGSIIKVYARAATKDGGIFIEVMTKAEIDKHRKISRATREDSPWAQHYSEMAKKTAIIRLSKYLPDARDIVGDEFDEDDSEPSTAPPGITIKATDGGIGMQVQASSAAQDQEADQATGQTEDKQGKLIDHESPPAAPVHHAAGGDGGGPSAPVPPSDVPQSAVRSPVSPTTDASPAATDSDVDIEVAYRRGQEAKKAGARRTAYPGEYRTLEREPLVHAWLNGYDQKPIDAP